MEQVGLLDQPDHVRGLRVEKPGVTTPLPTIWLLWPWSPVTTTAGRRRSQPHATSFHNAPRVVETADFYQGASRNPRTCQNGGLSGSTP
jgi:hypothetical protein